MPKSKSNKSAESLPNIGLAVRHKTATDMFKAKASGDNYVEDFCRIADRVLATKRTFDLADFAYCAKYLDIPFPIIAGLYRKWSEVMVQSCRLAEMQGIDGMLLVQN